MHTPPEKHIVMTGATGLLGTAIYRKLRERGYAVTVLSRNPVKATRAFPDARQCLLWAPGVRGEWQQAIDGAEGVVHLAGATIFGRMTERYKRQVYDSRVNGTRSIVEAMKACKTPPHMLFVNSAVGYYGATGEAPVDESAPPGDDFLASVCRAWEAEAMEAQSDETRVAICRTGIVLSTEGGALATMLPFFKLGLGAWLGSGKQWFPWVHIDDVSGMVMHILETPSTQGAYNMAAPGIVRNKQYSKMVGKVLHRSVLFPVPGFVLFLALKGFAKSVLDHKHITPKRTLESGYVFAFPELMPALEDLL